MIVSNPIGGGHYTGIFEFKHPIQCLCGDGRIFSATQMFVEFVLSGGWFEQSAVIHGTAGVYDFLRRRVWVGTGPYQLHFKDMDLTKGEPIDYPPITELDVATGVTPGGVGFQLLFLENAKCHEPIPPLDEVIVERDLSLEIGELPPELRRAPRDASVAGLKTQTYISWNPKVGPGHTFTLTSSGCAPTQ